MDMANLKQYMFVEYDSMGAIYGFRSTHAEPGAYKNGNGKLLVTERPDPLTKWVSDGKLKDRPINPTVLRQNVLSNIPTPSTIRIDGTDYPCNTDTVTLDFPNPGIYNIEIICFPFQNKTFQLKK